MKSLGSVSFQYFAFRKPTNETHPNHYSAKAFPTDKGIIEKNHTFKQTLPRVSMAPKPFHKPPAFQNRFFVHLSLKKVALRLFSGLTGAFEA